MLSWLKNDDCVTLINASSLHTTKFNVTSRVDQIHSAIMKALGNGFAETKLVPQVTSRDDGYIGITIKQLNFFWSFKIQVKSVDHVYQNEIIKTTVTRDDLVILANGAPTSSDYVKMQEK
jgi:hypothetical protein